MINLDEKYDIVVIGAGIVGINVAIQLAQRKPELSVLVVEKEKNPGLHASGRNSGVIHAGFYYSPDSLKAKFCREGNEQLRNLCEKLSIPIRETGKVVVSQHVSQVDRLEQLFQRGLTNGVELEIYEDKYLQKFEPLARSQGGFIWSPNTAIADPKLLMTNLVKFATAVGVKFSYGCTPIIMDDGIRLGQRKISYKHLVNSAGTQSIAIANVFGVGTEYSLLPILGTYVYSNYERLPLKTLVYPLPDPINPFLGVHFTITTDGFVKIGPSAIPVFGHEQYSLMESPNYFEIIDSAKSISVMALHHPSSTLKLILRELPKIFTSKLLKDAEKLIPSSKKGVKWEKKAGGIRPQLVNLSSGVLEQDFIVKSNLYQTHILNTISPGWTSAIPFAEWITKTHILPKL